jgi:hypothetical protein
MLNKNLVLYTLSMKDDKANIHSTNQNKSNNRNLIDKCFSIKQTHQHKKYMFIHWSIFYILFNINYKNVNH